MSRFTEQKTTGIEVFSKSNVIPISEEVITSAKSLGFNTLFSTDKVHLKSNEIATAIFNKISLKKLGVNLEELDDKLYILNTELEQGTLATPLKDIVSKDGKWRLVRNSTISNQSQTFFLEVNGVRRAVVKIKASVQVFGDISQSYINEAIQIETVKRDLISEIKLPDIIFASQSVLIEEYIDGVPSSEEDKEEILQYSTSLLKYLQSRSKLWENILLDTVDFEEDRPIPAYRNFIRGKDKRLYCIDPFKKVEMH